MTTGTKISIKKKPKKVFSKLKKMNKQFKNMPGVLVGFPKGTPAHKDKDGHINSMIEIAITQEFGLGFIPERSFLRSVIAEKRPEYKKLLEKLAKQVSAGKITGKKAISLLGEKMQGDVRQKMTDIKEPALKMRVGGNPLVDTGHLRQAVTYIQRR